MRTTHKAEVK